MEQVNRIIHYYELNVLFNPSFIPSDGLKFRELFRIITKLAREKHHQRYQIIGDKVLFLNEVDIRPDQHILYGKLKLIRKDLFPELMNTSTDEERAIEALEEEGIVETTHFAIHDKNNKQVLAIEYNLYGAKINDFANYISLIGMIYSATTSIRYTPIVRDQLESLKSRLGRCSQFEVKVHKDNIEAIKDVDAGTYSALKMSREHFNTDYAQLTLNFDYKHKTSTPEVNNIVFKLINLIKRDRSNIDIFQTLRVTAEDADRNDKLQVFDLLIDKVKSNIKVERKQKHRSLVSTDMFQKMYSEMIRSRII